jgi:hypothetical protein
MKSGFRWWGPVASVACALIAPSSGALAGPHDALITKHAAAHGVPESLVRRVIHIESKGNARVVSKGNYGLMQIRLGTAKGMGYRGTAEGLLDPDTNMTYAVKYLALAYRAAGCSEQGAIGYYQRGFYKKPRGKCPTPATQIAKVEPAARQGAQRTVASDGEASSLAQAEVLKPRVVQVQTITRPKTATQPAAAPQPAATQPVAAPVQVAVAPKLAAAPPAPAASTPAPAVAAPAPAAVQPAAAPVQVAVAPKLAAAPPAPAASTPAPIVAAPAPVAVQPVAAPVQVAVAPKLAATSPAPAASTPAPVVAAPAPVAVQPATPQTVPPPQTVAKAPEQDVSAAPQASHAVPTVFMELLPMPRPRPATAPRMVAKLDVAVVSEPSSKNDGSAVSSDLQIMKPEPAAAPPMPKPRPAKAPQAMAKLDAAVVSESSSKNEASAASPDLQIMKPEPAAALPMPKPRPATAPQAVAKLDAAVTSEPSPNSDASTASPDVQVAKLDPVAVPLPQPKPVIDAVPEEESKQARRKSHTRVARHRAPKQQESALVTFWKNLTTPQPARRRR